MLKDLGRKVEPHEVADFFGLKESTIQNNWKDYGGVKIGRRVLFFENLIVNKVREEHALQSERQKQNPVEGTGKKDGIQGRRGTLSYKGGSSQVGRQSPCRGNKPLGGTRKRDDDPLGLAP